MCTFYHSKLPALISCLVAMFTPLATVAEDIDIFTGASGGTAPIPQVLIILENTTNWSRQSEKWAGGITQGQAEVAAIKTVINSSVAQGMNIGLMEFVTGSGDPGAFIRFAVQPISGVAG